MSAVRLVYTLVAECDPAPSDDYMQAHGAELDEALEAALADFLRRAGADASIGVAVYVDR